MQSVRGFRIGFKTVTTAGQAKFHMRHRIILDRALWLDVTSFWHLAGGWVGAAALSAGIGVYLAAIAAIDLKTLRIPDYLSLPLVAAGLAMAAAGPRDILANHLIGAGAGFLLLAVFGEIFYRLRGREGLGLGDAKLFAAAGAWLGWQSLPYVMVLASIGGLCWALIQARGQIAFGPWIALGFWLCLQVQLFWPT